MTSQSVVILFSFIGMVIMASSFWLLTTMGIDTTKLTATMYMMLLGMGLGLVMPILTLALQESFPPSELGVVTSSSQFFRSIGGTFGMTILGAIMNSRSDKLLSENLIPVLNKLPVQAKAMVDQFTAMIHKDPQALYAMLLSPKAMAQMPAQFKDIIVPIIKNSLVDSLNGVFWFGLVFMILGGLLTIALKKVTLKDKNKVDEKKASKLKLKKQTTD